MANVLILSLVFRPDNVSTAQIMGDLALDLKEYGHNVFVLTTVPHYNIDTEALAKQPLFNYLGKFVQRSNYQGIKVFHVWMPRKGKNKLLRIIAWIMFHIISTLMGILTRFKPDIILAPSPPLTIGVSAWLLGCWHDCPFIYNVQEIYPDIAVNLGVLKNIILIKILQNLESFVYRKAKALAVISDGMANCIKRKGIPGKKIHVIPNFVDVEEFHPLPKDNEFSRKYGLNNKFVVSYAGNMGKPQGLDVLIQAAHILRNEDKIHFLLMGSGSEKDALIEKSKQLKLTNNITFLPYQPYSLMAKAYATADVSFVSQVLETSNDGIPSKVYRIMACGRPVIACTNEDSDLAFLIKKAEGGDVVNPNNPSKLAETIQKAFSQHDIWIEKGRKARKFIIENYSRSIISNLYNELILENSVQSKKDICLSRTK